MGDKGRGGECQIDLDCEPARLTTLESKVLPTHPHLIMASTPNLTVTHVSGFSNDTAFAANMRIEFWC